MDLEVSKSQNMVWCPKPDCNTACNFPHQSNNAVCPTCFNDFCIKCLKDWHFGSPCQLEDLTDLNVKNCPTCSIPIHRTEGCDAMFCSRCTTWFCWECLQPTNGHSGRCSCKLTTMLYNNAHLFAFEFVHVLCAIFLYSLMLTFLGYLQIEFNKNTDKNLRFMSFWGTFALLYWVFYVQPFFRFDAPDFRTFTFGLVASTFVHLWVCSLVVELYQL